MALYLVSYDIFAPDDRVEVELDHAVFDEIDNMNSKTVVAGMWYINSNQSPNAICKSIIKAFKKKKRKLNQWGFKNKILNEARISLCVHKLAQDEWVILNGEEDLKFWLKNEEIGDETNLVYAPV